MLIRGYDMPNNHDEYAFLETGFSSKYAHARPVNDFYDNWLRYRENCRPTVPDCMATIVPPFFRSRVI